MTAYIILPELTLGANELSERFYKTCLEELSMHIPTQVLSTETVMQSIRLTRSDAIIFFNRSDEKYPPFIIDFLNDAVADQCRILPIAITRDERIPPNCVKQAQSFDVFEHLRQRSLSESLIETVAVVFARNVIAELQPTLSKNNMYLFLSHRRFDGELIAGAFHDAFTVRAQEAFRDLNKVLVGQDAQNIIEENLRQSDAVIFLDTPKSGDSEWIAKELTIAMSAGLPIIWIRIGSEEGRSTTYSIRPTGQPHFNLPQLDPTDTTINSSIVDAIIHKAFEISREHAKTILGHIKRLRTLSRNGSIKLTELDNQLLTYQIDIPRRGYRYYQRPMTHVVGFYGWIPQVQDQDQFMEKVQSTGYQPHPLLGHVYDAALMLAPIASCNNQDLINEPHKIDSCDEYINSLESYLNFPDYLKRDCKKGVIISGAYPDCEPEHQQHITDAVRAFTQAVLSRNGQVIFGAHPTFQHLIFDMAKEKRPEDFQTAVHMYVSRYFVTEGNIEESRKNAIISPTEAVFDDRAKSLTAMREAMINDPEAAFMVVIGGKTNRPDLLPGVDEEIALAKKRNLPIFLIGATGGRTSQIASEMSSTGWKAQLNDFSVEINHELMVSLDFPALANKVLDKMKL